MNREIKFRAWTGKRMMEPSRNMVLDSYDGLVSWSFGGNRPEPLDCILMQFTGLKDKNGVEIYEGDIVELPEGAYHKNFNAPIVYKNGKFIIDSFLAGDLFDFANNCEVIGNIYSNPELLDNQAKA